MVDLMSERLHEYDMEERYEVLRLVHRIGTGTEDDGFVDDASDVIASKRSALDEFERQCEWAAAAVELLGPDKYYSVHLLELLREDSWDAVSDARPVASMSTDPRQFDACDPETAEYPVTWFR